MSILTGVVIYWFLSLLLLLKILHSVCVVNSTRIHNDPDLIKERAWNQFVTTIFKSSESWVIWLVVLVSAPLSPMVLFHFKQWKKGAL